MKSLCNRRVSEWNPDTLKEIVRFVHEVHPVFAVTLSTFLHMLCGWNDDTMPTFNLFRVHLKGGMVSSFDPHNMCKNVERVTAKTGCTSWTKWTTSFEVSGFQTKTHLLQKALHFFKLITTPDFLCVHYAPFKATSSTFNPFCLHFLFFMHILIFLSYKTLKLKSIWNELWKGWKLAWYHHLTHIACSRM